MKLNIKVSFLIAAHNEEKVISKTLDNLLTLPYKNYEVLIGLDGCTDNTFEIVKNYSKKSKKFKPFILNLRSGKTEVVNFLMKKARGEVIIINDADWIFNVEDKKTFEEMIKIFNNKEIGGIAESFPITYPLRANAKLLETGMTVQNKLWMDYIKSFSTKIDENWSVLDREKFPMLVNIFRKELFRENETLGDDFERCIYIFSQNKKVVATNNLHIPRMISVGENYKFGQIIRQKERTAIARKQLKNKLNGKRLGVGLMGFIVESLPDLSIKEIFGLIVVSFAFVLGTIRSILSGKKVSTKEGWKMRLAR
ncbi:MAG: glycosyltransferase [Candidatus Pacearchaeota archaeon]